MNFFSCILTQAQLSQFLLNLKHFMQLHGFKCLG